MADPMIQAGPEDDWTECSDCGEPIAEAAPSFAFDGEMGEVLCLACAIRRGGQYDMLKDHWKVVPDTHDLRRAPQ